MSQLTWSQSLQNAVELLRNCMPVCLSNILLYIPHHSTLSPQNSISSVYITMYVYVCVCTHACIYVLLQLHRPYIYIKDAPTGPMKDQCGEARAILRDTQTENAETHAYTHTRWPQTHSQYLRRFAVSSLLSIYLPGQVQGRQNSSNSLE